MLWGRDSSERSGFRTRFVGLFALVRCIELWAASILGRLGCSASESKNPQRLFETILDVSISQFLGIEFYIGVCFSPQPVLG